MRRGIGTVLSTGIALVGAAVVVANPVTAPPSDVKVPAVELSVGAGASAGLVDQSFLNAIAQHPDPADAAPVNTLKRLLAQLVTDAAIFGGKAVEGAVQGQDVLVVPPALTAASVPYLPPAPAPIDPAAVAAQIAPILRQSITTLADDVGAAGGQVVAAAVAAGALVESEPTLMSDTLAELATGDLKTALQAVSTPPLPVAHAISTVVHKGLGELTDPLALAAQSALAPVASIAPSPRPLPAPARPGAAVALRAAAESPDTVNFANGATDVSHGNKVAPHATASTGRLRDKVTAVVDSARTAVGHFADAARAAVSTRVHTGANASSEN